MNHNCPKCNNPMKESRLLTYGNVFNLTAEPEELICHKKTPIQSYVCTNCGYIEFYAKNPQILK